MGAEFSVSLSCCDVVMVIGSIVDWFKDITAPVIFFLKQKTASKVYTE